MVLLVILWLVLLGLTRLGFAGVHCQVLLTVLEMSLLAGFDGRLLVGFVAGPSVGRVAGSYARSLRLFWLVLLALRIRPQFYSFCYLYFADVP